MKKQILVCEQLVLSLRNDKVRLVKFAVIYFGLFALLFFKNGLTEAIIGVSVPLTIASNLLVLKDCRVIFLNIKSNILPCFFLLGGGFTLNGFIIWVSWPQWTICLSL